MGREQVAKGANKGKEKGDGEKSASSESKVIEVTWQEVAGQATIRDAGKANQQRRRKRKCKSR